MGVLKGPSPLRLAKALTSLAHSSMSPLFLFSFLFFPFFFPFSSSLLFQLLAHLFVFQSVLTFCIIARFNFRASQIWRGAWRPNSFLFPPFSVAAQPLFYRRRNVQRRKSKHPHPVRAHPRSLFRSLISTICRPNTSSVKSYSSSRTSIVSFKIP